jgi:hypothetical protein
MISIRYGTCHVQAANKTLAGHQGGQQYFIYVNTPCVPGRGRRIEMERGRRNRRDRRGRRHEKALRPMGRVAMAPDQEVARAWVLKNEPAPAAGERVKVGPSSVWIDPVRNEVIYYLDVDHEVFHAVHGGDWQDDRDESAIGWITDRKTLIPANVYWPKEDDRPMWESAKTASRGSLCIFVPPFDYDDGDWPIVISNDVLVGFYTHPMGLPEFLKKVEDVGTSQANGLKECRFYWVDPLGQPESSSFWLDNSEGHKGVSPARFMPNFDEAVRQSAEFEDRCDGHKRYFPATMIKMANIYIGPWEAPSKGWENWGRQARIYHKGQNGLLERVKGLFAREGDDFFLESALVHAVGDLTLPGGWHVSWQVPDERDNGSFAYKRYDLEVISVIEVRWPEKMACEGMPAFVGHEAEKKFWEFYAAGGTKEGFLEANFEELRAGLQEEIKNDLEQAKAKLAKENELKDTLLAWPSEKLTTKDSLEAGNCRQGAERFLQQFGLEEPVHFGALAGHQDLGLMAKEYDFTKLVFARASELEKAVKAEKATQGPPASQEDVSSSQAEDEEYW